MTRRNFVFLALLVVFLSVPTLTYALSLFGYAGRGMTEDNIQITADISSTTPEGSASGRLQLYNQDTGARVDALADTGWYSPNAATISATIVRQNQTDYDYVSFIHYKNPSGGNDHASIHLCDELNCAIWAGFAEIVKGNLHIIHP